MPKRMLILRKVGGLYFLTPREMATEAGLENSRALGLKLESKEKVPDAIFDGQETKEAAIALADSVGCRALSYSRLRADVAKVGG
jgi:hypothetical protein